MGGKLKPLKYRKAVVSKKKARIKAKKNVEFLSTQENDSNEVRERDLQYSCHTEQSLYEKNGGLHHMETDSDLENVGFTSTEKENTDEIKSCSSKEDKQNDVNFNLKRNLRLEIFFHLFSEEDNS